MTNNNTIWTPSSWREKPIRQMPTYEDAAALKQVEANLKKYPPLIFAGEARTLKKELAQVCMGNGFVFHGGDCAESFEDFAANNVRDTFRVFLQIALILTFAGKKNVTKISRLAGQFAKPRSSDFEEKDGIKLPSYRGDMINGIDFTKESRMPDPARLERAYFQSASTLNLLRAFAGGGYADLHRAHHWLLDFISDSQEAHRYEDLIARLTDCLSFMQACDITGQTSSQIRGTSFYTSHEALHLNYEEALARTDSINQMPYATSGHYLWIGDRTRQLDGAHIEFLRGVDNPIGVKCGPSLDPNELKELIEALNPQNEAGRLTLIVRVGAGKVQNHLPDFIRIVKDNNFNVVWNSDAVHGNTYKSESGYKTRNFDHVVQETREFFEICRAEGAYPGGVHIEMTGKDVTECVGGHKGLADGELVRNYDTLCDPRLNARQSTEYAFEVAKLLNED